MTWISLGNIYCSVKKLPAVQELQKPLVLSLGQEDPWRRAWQPTPVFWAGEFHGHMSLAAWGCEEWDGTEVT